MTLLDLGHLDFKVPGLLVPPCLDLPPRSEASRHGAGEVVAHAFDEGQARRDQHPANASDPHAADALVDPLDRLLQVAHLARIVLS